MPVTTMEEVPVLTDSERSELLTSLQQAERDITAGRGVDYDPKTFKDRLLRIFRRAKSG